MYCSEDALSVASPAFATLSYWCSATKRLPLFSSLARKYLDIPATSVLSERVFSAAGYIVSNRRASMKPAKVNQMTFLHFNWHK